MNYLKNEQALKMIHTLIPDKGVFEIRIEGRGVSGCFEDPELAIESLSRQPLNNTRVLVSINEINRNIVCRKDQNGFSAQGTALEDNDIEGLNWVLVSIEPKRPHGTSSTQEELTLSRETAEKITRMLLNEGFPHPVIGSSGNGTYLLIRVNLSNTEGAIQVINDFLSVLDKLFSTDAVDVGGRYKPTQSVVLAGTAVQEGQHTKERPHRYGTMLSVPSRIVPVQASYLKEVAQSLSADVNPEAYNHYSPKTFEVGDFLEKHHMTYQKEVLDDGTEKYVLDICPWDGTVKRNTIVFQYQGGGVAVKCLHDQYKDKSWSDLRRLLEPTEEEHRETVEQERLYHSFARNDMKEEDGLMFQSAMDVLLKKTPDLTYVKTGITGIDKKMRGLQRQGTSVWSGTRSSGKSNLLTQICINAVNDGNRVLYFNFETNDKSYMEWAYRQIAGPAYCVPTDYDNYYLTEPEVKEKIARWLGDKLYIYNNAYGNDMALILEKLDAFMSQTHIDLCVIDNMMAAKIVNLSNEQWRDGAEIHAQTALIQSLKWLAEKHNCHIALVCHPRKQPPNGGLLKMDDISGTGNLPNATDACFIVYRSNPSLKTALTNDRGIKDGELTTCDNIVSIEKDKQNGTVALIPLWYNIPSKRFLNTPTENVVYPWNDEGLSVQGEEPIEVPKEKTVLVFPSLPTSPERQRLSRALTLFLKRHENEQNASEVWRNILKDKVPENMTEEEWTVIERM